MKLDQLLMIVAGGVLTAIALKMLKLNGGAAAAQSSIGAQEVRNSALPGQPGYGWRYFNDGTAIAPNGDYYLNDNRVWTAPSALWNTAN